MTTYTVRIVRDSEQPESGWNGREGQVLYRGEDEVEARARKQAFDHGCDPCEGAVVLRDDGMVLRDDVDEWQAA